MLTPNIANRVRLDWCNGWAADTGLFSAHGERVFSLDKYLSWLEVRTRFLTLNLFATAPDCIGDWQATLNRAIPAIPAIRSLGYRVAIVTQDGLDVRTIPWDLIDCLFIGGTDSHKLSREVDRAIAEARRRGKWVHCGRVNNYKRFERFWDLGANSVDGTFLAYGPKTNIERLRKWFRKYREARGI